MDLRRMSSGLVTFVLALPLLHAQVRTAAQSDVSMTPDQNAVVATMRAMYRAASTDDLSLFHAQVVSDFYAFDNGQRFDGDALMNMVIAYHKKGVAFVWTVTKPDVHVSGDHAWITYTNVGSITMKAGDAPTAVTWLESAALVKVGDNWRIEFFHSSRVSPSGGN